MDSHGWYVIAIVAAIVGFSVTMGPDDVQLAKTVECFSEFDCRAPYCEGGLTTPGAVSVREVCRNGECVPLRETCHTGDVCRGERICESTCSSQTGLCEFYCHTDCRAYDPIRICIEGECVPQPL